MIILGLKRVQWPLSRCATDFVPTAVMVGAAKCMYLHSALTPARESVRVVVAARGGEEGALE